VGATEFCGNESFGSRHSGGQRVTAQDPAGQGAKSAKHRSAVRTSGNGEHDEAEHQKGVMIELPGMSLRAKSSQSFHAAQKPRQIDFA
jgi:hypothetical protein